MYFVHNSSVTKWHLAGNANLPVAANILCPYCKHSINITISWDRTEFDSLIMATTSNCTACRVNIGFILSQFRFIDKKTQQADLYVYPPPKVRHSVLNRSNNYGTDILSEGLIKAYTSAINVYNSGEWNATAVLCRRSLEGVTKSILPQEKKNLSLFQQLSSLPEHVDLRKPILTLADAIRKGGNLGAHFDLEKETSKEIATLMLDMLDYLIEYLFILPVRIEKLHTSIDVLEDS